MAFQHILLNRLIFIVIIIPTAKFMKTNTEFNYNVSNGTHLKPLHYSVMIKYYIYKDVFFGECNITIQIYRQTNMITLYINTISVIKIDLFDDNNNEIINIKNFTLTSYESYKKMYIYFDLSRNFLSSDTYILKIKYRGMMLEEENFFDKKEEKLYNKGIEVIKAQKLFPYWNELVKTTFDISVIHHKGFECFSSMHMRQYENTNNTLWTHFDTTPLMSIKQLTIVITPLNYFFHFVSFGLVKFWCRKEMIDQVHIAENTAREVILYLIKKNRVSMSKIDYFVIKDFEYSNEKTLGFILLREEDIIYNYTLHPVRKMEVINLVAHKTIAYWFHDVPLWSKEGFITFLTAHILSQFGMYHRHHRIMDLYVVQTQQESLRFDTLPIDFHPSQTANISTNHLFGSSFHYIKSFVIWRMLYHILSDNVFWNSIITYTNIERNQRNVTDINNFSFTVFWNAVERALGIINSSRNFIIEDIINVWLTERHCPVLYVTRNFTDIIISYINSKYILLADNKQYEVYVVYTMKSLMNFETYHFWLSTLMTDHVISHKIDNNDWINLNSQLIGYYRINYDFDHWQKLADYLNENYTRIHVLDRAQIIDDAIYFLTQGQLSNTLFWDIINFLSKDTDYVTWYPMIKAVEYMTCIWPVQIILSEKWLIRKMFAKLLDNIGYDDNLDEHDFAKYLREEAVKWLCVFGDSNCRETATSKLEEEFRSDKEEKFFKKEWIYCKGSMTADLFILDKVWHKWQTTLDSTFLEYFSCSTNYVIIQSYLDLIIADKIFNATNSKKNANIFLLTVAKHAKNNAILEFIFSKLEFLKFSLKNQIDQIATLIVIITHEHDVEGLRKIRELVTNNDNLMHKNLVDVIKKKVKKRQLERDKQIANYRRAGVVIDSE